MEFACVDAFTTDPFQGNPAAVVLDAAALSDEKMQMLAREMNLSETVYTLPPTSAEADIRIRGFTSTTEVPLCGHATIACFARMAELGRLPKQALRVETASGILPVVVDGKTVWFSLPLPTFSYWKCDKRRLAKALTIPESAIDDMAPALSLEQELEYQSLGREMVAASAVESFLDRGMYREAQAVMQDTPGLTEVMSPETQRRLQGRIATFQRAEEAAETEARRKVAAAQIILGRKPTPAERARLAGVSAPAGRQTIA